MKKSIKTLLTTILLAVATMLSLTACGDGSTGGDEGECVANTYKVAIVKYVDDASLNQIEDAIEAQLTAKEKELGVDFEIIHTTVRQMVQCLIRLQQMFWQKK